MEGICLFVTMGSLIFAVVTAISFLIGVNRRAAWRAMAQQLGYRFQTPRGWSELSRPGAMYGESGGFQVTVDVEIRGSGKNQQVWTRVRVQHGVRLGLGLSVRPEGGLDFFGKMFGGQDIEVGDAAFDDKMRIQGHNEERVMRLLTADVRRTFATLAARSGQPLLDDTHVQWAKLGVVRDLATLQGVIQSCVRVARAVSEAHSAEAVRAHVGVDASVGVR